MAGKLADLVVRSATGETAPFSVDHFAGTLVRHGAPVGPSLLAAGAVHGLLVGAGVRTIDSPLLATASSAILANAAFLDLEALGRTLIPHVHVRPVLSFSQRAIAFDGKAAPRSDWGAVSVRCAPAEATCYLNIAIDGEWRIRNAPIFPAQGGAPNETLFYFDLGVKDGVIVRSLNVAASLEITPASTPPALYAMRPVGQVSEEYWTNFEDQPYEGLAAPAGVYTGGRVDGNFYCRLNFPNQPCGKNECAPTAVSNNLRWLDREYHLNLGADVLTIDFWKTALGWQNDGVIHGAWADAKKKFTDDKVNKLPIDTTKESGGHVAKALDEFNGNKSQNRVPQALEVDIGSHVASVICIGGPDVQGHYHIDAASDIAQKGQNAPGNPVTQQIEITAGGDVVSGPPWAQGQKVQNFIIQCPHPGKFK